MGQVKFWAIITTIAPPTESVRQFAGRIAAASGELLIVGDAKGPTDYPLQNASLLSYDAQLASKFRLARGLPSNHYVRKNLGYLSAIERGADCLFETDDDNAPLEGWQPRELKVDAQKLPPNDWQNVYSYFYGPSIWPRGFSLRRLASAADAKVASEEMTPVAAPIQQGLVNGSPDVDAIWRLTQDRMVTCQPQPSIVVPPGCWCPFNSQNTWWWRDAFPLLYLPSCCSFRMTDIWRSFIAQRCLWELDCGVVFHAADVVQDRNPHNLMKDFEQEIPGYLNNDRLVECLGLAKLERGREAVADNIRTCYEILVQEQFLPDAELKLVNAWLYDLRQIEVSHD